MKQKLNLVAIVLVFITFTSCNKNKKSEKTTKTEQSKIKTPKKDCKDVHWSHHKGENGPEHWGNLYTGFADCSGSLQSPIDIVTTNIELLKCQGNHQKNQNQLVLQIKNIGQRNT